MLVHPPGSLDDKGRLLGLLLNFDLLQHGGRGVFVELQELPGIQPVQAQLVLLQVDLLEFLDHEQLLRPSLLNLVS